MTNPRTYEGCCEHGELLDKYCAQCDVDEPKANPCKCKGGCKMENNKAIVIAKTSNGFVIYQIDDPQLPNQPENIATFSDLGQTGYDSRTVTGFLERHFRDEPENHDKPSAV